MKALVVYESFWGNTAAIAEAIAEGIGDGARAVRTDEAIGDALAGADLLVVGAPLMGFALPRQRQRGAIAADRKAPRPADVSHQSMRAWLASLPARRGSFATFETRFKRSPGSATRAMSRALQQAGYRPAAKRQRFFISGTYGPMLEGEIDRARRWGADLAKAVF